MNRDELEKLVLTYGTVPANWPADRRQAMSALIAMDPEANAVIERLRPLDDALDVYDVKADYAGIEARILARLPAPQHETLLDRLMDWIIPSAAELRLVWRPALVAALPLIVGMVLGSTLQIDSLDTSTSNDSWDDEIYLLALDTTSQESLP